MTAYLTGLDLPVLQYLALHRDITTSLSFIGITELGSTVFVCGVALCIGLYLALRHKVVYALALAVSVLGAGTVVLLIKEFFRRTRPEKMYQAYAETGFSFPSGHATLAAAFYGFLIYLAWRMLPPGFLRSATVSALALLIALIAFSRLYLGVHYLTDVLGGLLLGAAFAYLGTLFVRKFEGRA